MTALTPEDRELLTGLHHELCRDPRGDRCDCELTETVEAIVAAHVTAALNEAADAIEADMNHDACRNATLATAARIVRARTT